MPGANPRYALLPAGGDCETRWFRNSYTRPQKARSFQGGKNMLY